MVIAARIGDDGSKRLTPFLVTTMAISTGALINGPQPVGEAKCPTAGPDTRPRRRGEPPTAAADVFSLGAR
jgi:hypothetical protein